MDTVMPIALSNCNKMSIVLVVCPYNHDDSDVDSKKKNTDGEQ